MRRMLAGRRSSLRDPVLEGGQWPFEVDRQVGHQPVEAVAGGEPALARWCGTVEQVAEQLELARGAERPASALSSRAARVYGRAATGSRSAVSVDYQVRLHERLPALPASIAPLRHAVLAFASHSGASARRREDIALAVSEALGNAVLHAYVGQDSPGSMAVEARVDGKMLEVTVCDDGIGMRPRTDSPGLGLGLSLIVRVTDHVELDRHEAMPGVRMRMTFVIG